MEIQPEVIRVTCEREVRAEFEDWWRHAFDTDTYREYAWIGWQAHHNRAHGATAHAALVAELAEEKAAHWRTCQTAAHEAEERDKAEAKLQAAERDAARYRILRLHTAPLELFNRLKRYFPMWRWVDVPLDQPITEKVDELIDAALAQSAKGEG